VVNPLGSVTAATSVPTPGRLTVLKSSAWFATTPDTIGTAAKLLYSATHHSHDVAVDVVCVNVHDVSPAARPSAAPR
jgi:phosphoribosylaminoimidazole (AIR) synthetase